MNVGKFWTWVKIKVDIFYPLQTEELKLFTVVFWLFKYHLSWMALVGTQRQEQVMLQYSIRCFDEQYIIWIYKSPLYCIFFSDVYYGFLSVPFLTIRINMVTSYCDNYYWNFIHLFHANKINCRVKSLRGCHMITLLLVFPTLHCSGLRCLIDHL